MEVSWLGSWVKTHVMLRLLVVRLKMPFKDAVTGHRLPVH